MAKTVILTEDQLRELIGSAGGLSDFLGNCRGEIADFTGGSVGRLHAETTAAAFPDLLNACRKGGSES